MAGFEFRIGEETQQRLRRRADPKAVAAHVAAVLTSAQLTAQEGRIGFARLPADWLGLAPAPAKSARIWIGLEFAPGAAVPASLAPALQSQRVSGALVGWDPTVAQADARPEFLLRSQGATGMPIVLEQLRQRPAALAGLPVVLMDIANLDDFELALTQGVDYLCGALTADATKRHEGKGLPPEVQHIGSLMHGLASGADTSDIVSGIKGDIGLSYALLRRLNSAAYAQLETGGSIDKAVLMLGRRELHRWLSMLLLQYGPKRKVSTALQEIALWRSRLFELMAEQGGEPEAGRFFTLGLASLLGPMLGVSPMVVVDTLKLPADARAALIDQAGPWWVYLALAEQLNTQAERAELPAAARFGGMAAVQALSDQAWTWAARHVDRG
jgi:EAL and modified HD-GYP domain-containing signal transduction protein